MGQLVKWLVLLQKGKNLFSGLYIIIIIIIRLAFRQRCNISLLFASISVYPGMHVVYIITGSLVVNVLSKGNSELAVSIVPFSPLVSFFLLDRARRFAS
jgi:lipid-A-disaccharide synthase-like uncharacterized protein